MRYFVVDFKSQKYGIPKKSRGQFIAQNIYTMLRINTYNCFLAWSVFVWYAIKMDIRPRPVSIFSDYSAIKEYIYVMLRKQTWKWQHQTSRQSLHSWEFCTRLWSCFSDKSSLLSLRVNCLSCFYSWGTTLSFLFFVFWHPELLL